MDFDERERAMFSFPENFELIESKEGVESIKYKTLFQSNRLQLY